MSRATQNILASHSLKTPTLHDDTQTILINIVLRDYNSNIFNDFKSIFESMTWNCVFYGEF